MLAEEYEGYFEDNPVTTIFYCGNCSTEMEEVSRQNALCPKCSKRGYNILFRCPNCGEEILSFHQDIFDPPLCMSCN